MDTVVFKLQQNYRILLQKKEGYSICLHLCCNLTNAYQTDPIPI